MVIHYKFYLDIGLIDSISFLSNTEHIVIYCISYTYHIYKKQPPIIYVGKFNILHNLIKIQISQIAYLKVLCFNEIACVNYILYILVFCSIYEISLGYLSYLLNALFIYPIYNVLYLSFLGYLLHFQLFECCIYQIYIAYIS